MSQQHLTVYYDVGTTNMRLFLLDEQLDVVLTTQQVSGAKDAAIAHTEHSMLHAMYDLYQQALTLGNVTDADVSAIYASGMITSRDGICDIPHALAPMSVMTFACQEVTPFMDNLLFKRTLHLVSGLKTSGDTISEINNCRGEEIELVGVLPTIEQRYPNQAVAVIMPGSHTHVLLAGKGELTGILSNFTGELFHALKQDTILSPILSTDSDHPDPRAVALGMENLNHYGFNRSLYIGHAMRVFAQETPHFRRCYSEAVVSGGVIQALDAMCQEQWQGCSTAVVVGNAYMSELFTQLLAHSTTIKTHSTILIDGSENSFALEGLRQLIALRKEAGYV